MRILNAFAEVAMGILLIFTAISTGVFIAGLIAELGDKLWRKM